MAEWTRGAKVGAFSLVLLVAMGALYNLVGKTRMGKKGITVYATFRDATGLAPLSRVQMAGIAIGNISAIRLTPEGRARVEIKIDQGVLLHEDASIAKQTATLLSEPFLALTPGAQGAPELADGAEIRNTVEPYTTDQILQKVGDITSDVRQVTNKLARTVGSDEGEQQMRSILRNVEAATAALSAIAQENRVSIRRTLQNVEGITADARPKTKKVLSNVDDATDRLATILKDNQPDIRATMRSTRETMDRATKITARLDSALGHVDSITGRIDRGEGTVGRLTKDDALIDEVQGAAEGINEFVGSIARLQTIVGLRSDYNFLSNSIKNYLEVRIQPREDKYYLIELVNDPRGRTTFQQIDESTTDPTKPAHSRTVRYVTENSLRFSIQFARRLGPLTGRFGLKESTGGVGLIFHALDDRFEVQQDLFGFGEQLIPRYRVSFTYEFVRRLWLLGGVDNLFDRDRRDYFVGLNLRFTDDDLKAFLFFAPKPT